MNTNIKENVLHSLLLANETNKFIKNIFRNFEELICANGKAYVFLT